MLALDSWIRQGQWQPSEVVVLVPFAQMMSGAKQAWAQAFPTSFVPRFETTRNWANRLETFVPGPEDLSLDAAHDAAVSAAMLASIELPGLDHTWRQTLAPQLVSAAQSVASVVSAIAPQHRQAWLQSKQAELALGTGDGFNKWESLLAALALNWAAGSRYATDVLWQPLAGQSCRALAVLPGLQVDALSEALLAHWQQQLGEQATTVLPTLQPTSGDRPAATVYEALDAQDEASLAAACVLAHLEAGRVPVAIVAQDRLLTKRIHAQLQTAGVDWRDETGWMLSTAPIAAFLMAWLQASHANATANQLLDVVKAAPLFANPTHAAPLGQWEAQLRKLQVRSADKALLLLDALPGADGVKSAAQVLRGWLSLARQQTPDNWREAVLTLLVSSEWLEHWPDDDATQQVLRMLRLGDKLLAQDALPSDLSNAVLPWSVAMAPLWQRMSVHTFTAWLRSALEGGSYKPPYIGRIEVSALPMAQLLGREVGAVVIAGCDAKHMPAYVSAINLWTPEQQAILGLPQASAQTQAALDAWCMATASPVLDVLWRRTDGDQVQLAAPWLTLLQSADIDDTALPSPWLMRRGWVAGVDRRNTSMQTSHGTAQPAPVLATHTPKHVSASAYQALRDCPYRFFAMQGLRLWESAELDEAVGARDLGNWLHKVLQLFHENRSSAHANYEADLATLDRLATQVRNEMGFEAAQFLPFDGNWVQLRDGYLRWLQSHESAGFVFEQAEHRMQRTLSDEQGEVVAITGTIDRIDHHPQTGARAVLDYKTERLDKTKQRVKTPLEDTQLAFYAALMQPSLSDGAELQTGYLNIAGQDSKGAGATQLVAQTASVELVDAMLQGVVVDIKRLQSGQALHALGDGAVCAYCAARGLCRKDFWVQAQ